MDCGPWKLLRGTVTGHWVDRCQTCHMEVVKLEWADGHQRAYLEEGSLPAPLLFRKLGGRAVC